VSSPVDERSPADERLAQWQRGGLLVAPPTGQPWAVSHAALPTVEQHADGRLDLYYSPRDARGRAHIARARLRVGEHGRLSVAAHEPEPVLSPGELGAFDDAGVTVSCIVAGADGEDTLLYYTGWALGVSVPFYFYAGVARRRAGEQRFERVSRAPILERNAVDPYLTASPWVLREPDGLWRMWYVACARWEYEKGPARPTHADSADSAGADPDPAGTPRHYYHVRYAESEDGIAWRREGRVAIDFADAQEYAMGRPCVLRERERYGMWFCARGDAYRLAYAESRDGLSWERDDARAALEGDAEESWDSQMQAYPIVFDHGLLRYMLYNGNGYGRCGIGYAIAVGNKGGER